VEVGDPHPNTFRLTLKNSREHRCTSLGGLAVTPTSLEIEQRLAGLK
jgi:hypothetical protein